MGQGNDRICLNVSRQMQLLQPEFLLKLTVTKNKKWVISQKKTGTQKKTKKLEDLYDFFFIVKIYLTAEHWIKTKIKKANKLA